MELLTENLLAHDAIKSLMVEALSLATFGETQLVKYQLYDLVTLLIGNLFGHATAKSPRLLTDKVAVHEGKSMLDLLTLSLAKIECFPEQVDKIATWIMPNMLTYL